MRWAAETQRMRRAVTVAPTSSEAAAAVPTWLACVDLSANRLRDADLEWLAPLLGRERAVSVICVALF
jgi:hypothetical protein